MEILVTHLTRMHGGHICVAGIDLATGKHVRPVLDNASLDRSLLATNGGALDIGHVVEIGRTWPQPTAPEVEDHVFGLPALKLVRKASAAELWNAMSRLAVDDLNKAFGTELQRQGLGSMVMPLGCGTASLACWRPLKAPSLDTEMSKGKPQIRFRFATVDGSLDLSLTDVRFWNITPAFERPFTERVLHADSELKKKRDFLLCVGLTRPFAPKGALAPVHWLQVNNIHFKDEVFPLAGPVPKWAEL